MNWKVEVKPNAEKYLFQLDTKTKKRALQAIRELEDHDPPWLHPKVRPLTGKLKGSYRMRIGNLRCLFVLNEDKFLIYFYAILPPGDVTGSPGTYVDVVSLRGIE